MNILTRLFSKTVPHRLSAENKAILRRFSISGSLPAGDVAISAKAGLERAVAELIYPDGQHLGNALMLTANGYLVTCLHCLNGKAKLVWRSETRSFRILKTDPRYDLALLKADTGYSAEISTLYCSSSQPKNGQLVVLMSRRDGELHMIGGVSDYSANQSVPVKGGLSILGQSRARLVSVSGDSGGIIATTAGEFLGIHTCANADGWSCFTPWSRIYRLIQKYCEDSKDF